MLRPERRRSVMISLIAEEIGRLTRREVTPAEQLSWQDDLPLGEGDQPGLGLDSLGRIDVASRLNQFFHLHAVGIEDYLLIEKTIGRWDFIIAEGLKRVFDEVTFQTSGSTGTPKTCTHRVAHLLAETDELAEVLRRPTRIVAMAPPHHIYGFLFTALLPSRLEIPVLDARPLSPGRLREALAPGDLIVATPHLWRYLATSLPRFPAGVSGATSTAPMPADLARQLIDQGLERLTEVYGSSETAGIGWRDDPSQPFRLFDAWSVAEDREAIRRIEPDGSRGDPIPFADHVVFEGERTIRPVGRRDGAVQVGGVNVFPDRVRRRIEACDGVAAAAVRAFAVGGDAARQRLKTFIVPAAGVDAAALEASIRAALASELSDVERPAAYRFGPELPVSAIGKAIDWD
jgi:4-coumarate--CoA ligase